MRRSLLFLVILALGGPLLGAGADAGPAEDTELGERLAAVLRAGRGVVSNNQDLINDPSVADKGIDGDSVVRDAIALYTERMGSAPLTDTTSDRERRLIEALIASIREVVEEHEQLIDTAELGFKGFIPAIFGRLVGERFAEKVGDEALLKVTAPEELIRNRKALPDSWEKKVIQEHFLRPDWQRGEPFTETVEVGGRPAFRILMPEYYSASCLTCHGEPAGDMDVTGYPKEGGAEGDLGGAISITLFQ